MVLHSRTSPKYLKNSRICTLEFGLFMASPKIIESPSQIKVCKMSKIERIFIRIPLSIFFWLNLPEIYSMQKQWFSVKDFFTLAKEILNRKLHFFVQFYRCSRSEVLCKKDLKNFEKFTRKHPCQSIFLIDLRPTTLLKKRL